MKKMLFISLMFLFNSCKKENPQDILQEIVEDKILYILNDPESYEFQSFTLDSTEYLINKKYIQDRKNKLDSLRKNGNDFEVKMLNRIINIEEKVNKKMFPGKFNGIFNFRANNKFGAKILTSYQIYADSTYDLIYIIDNLNDTIYKK
ncbi:hypothetical protein [Flavobacterium okayamense]|uniref:Uncharacterized protein n=1 Tax=Flavobacterium okayamense TaxID=2830782 RepID=A0ABN6I3W3_9FLAO|nr:hypothetical protein [Flavobacterium okayamense]BCY29138.1 hypothetical protein KK2020170_20060 [Flavobacterium okayamense]